MLVNTTNTQIQLLIVMTKTLYNTHVLVIVLILGITFMMLYHVCFMIDEKKPFLSIMFEMC